MGKKNVVLLPSMGRLNNFDGKVTITEMTIESEGEMLSNSSPTQKTMTMVQTCIEKPKDLDVGDLPLVDIMYLFFEIRALSIEKEYLYPLNCSHCDFEFQHSLIIPEDLDILYATEDHVEPMSIKLPRSKDTLLIRTLTGNDHVYIEKKAQDMLKGLSRNGFRPGKGNKKANFAKLLYELRVATQIVGINKEKVSTNRALPYIKKMVYMDSTALKDFFEMECFGMDTDVEVECPRCGREDIYTVNMRPEFFRPDRKKRFKRRKGISKEVLEE